MGYEQLNGISRQVAAFSSSNALTFKGCSRAQYTKPVVTRPQKQDFLILKTSHSYCVTCEAADFQLLSDKTSNFKHMQPRLSHLLAY